MTAEKRAIIYRMVMDKHVCPYGLKSLHLLKRQGYAVEDHWLRDRAETDAYKAKESVQTTPQTFIAGKRIGGYDDLRRFFGKPVAAPGEVSYRPVIVVFAMTALMALAALTLPIALAPLPLPAPGWEVVWVPALFALSIGPVFLVVSAQASLIQRWFAAAPGAGVVLCRLGRRTRAVLHAQAAGGPGGRRAEELRRAHCGRGRAFGAGQRRKRA